MYRSRRLLSTWVLCLAVALVPGLAGAQGIFSDGFESGDVTSWSSFREQRPGTLDVNTTAALDGQFGLEIVGGARAWVETREPERETTVDASFFFFTENNWEMLVKAKVEILRFSAQGRRHHLRLILGQEAPGLFRIALLVRGNQGGYEPIASGLVAAGVVNLVGVKWQAASTRNGTDGSASLWINGELEGRAPNLANGRFDVRSIRLGAIAGQTSSTRGSLYFDTFESFRTLAP